MIYKIKTRDKRYEIEADNQKEALMNLVGQGEIQIDEQKVEEFEIYNQLLYRGIKFGTKRSTDMADYGCKLFTFAIILQRDPIELDKFFCEKNVYFGTSGDLIDDVAVAKALGWEFNGRDYNIDHMPILSPTIKEVDFSPAPGKQQHFVVRCVDETGRYILDPFGGARRKINYYEEKSHQFVSYRVFEVK